MSSSESQLVDPCAQHNELRRARGFTEGRGGRGTAARPKGRVWDRLAGWQGRMGRQVAGRQVNGKQTANRRRLDGERVVQV